MSRAQNICGERIRTTREKAGITQDQLAARCGNLGWPVSRESMAKIESGIRRLADFELFCLARALKADVHDLLPSEQPTKAMIQKLFEGYERT